MKSTEDKKQATNETPENNFNSPYAPSSIRNLDEKDFERKETKIFDQNKSQSNSGMKNKSKRFTLNSHVLNKKKKNLLEKKTKFEKISLFLLKLVENIYSHIFILICSVFTLLQDDIRNLALPVSVDQAFFRVNEFIFFLFLIEFIVISVCKKNFCGSFYFYLDLISIISMIPDINLIWNPIVDLMENSSTTIKEILGNSYFTKGSKASQAGAKYFYDKNNLIIKLN